MCAFAKIVINSHADNGTYQKPLILITELCNNLWEYAADHTPFPKAIQEFLIITSNRWVVNILMKVVKLKLNIF